MHGASVQLLVATVKCQDHENVIAPPLRMEVTIAMETVQTTMNVIFKHARLPIPVVYK